MTKKPNKAKGVIGEAIRRMEAAKKKNNSY